MRLLFNLSKACLMFEIYKPKERLQPGDKYLTKPEIAGGMKKRLTSDVYWDEIVSIEPIGNHQVYDLTIPETHNFVANDIFVHNSFIASFLALQMILLHNLPVIFFSLEMTKKQLEYRLWSLISVTNIYKHLNLLPLKSDRIRKHRAGNNPLEDWELDSISKIVGIAAELPLYINDSRGITVSGIAERMPSG